MYTATEKYPALHEFGKMVAIYRATNKINGKFYIGVTSKKPSVRKTEHICAAKSGSPYPFHRAIRKYGRENIEFDTLWYCNSYPESIEEEKRLIRILNPQYNVTLGGEGMLGYKHNPETVKIISEKRSKKLKGIFPHWLYTPESMEKKRIAFINRRGKPNLKNKGRIMSDETKKKISESKKGNSPLPAPHIIELGKQRCKLWHDKQRKPVICVTDGKEFKSATEAANFYGVHRGAVSNAARGKRKFLIKKVFIYKDKS